MPESVRVIVTGDRYWRCEDLANRVVKALREKHGPGLVIVHGAARGVDSAFSSACYDHEVTQEPHPAEWDGLGLSAGPTRNSEMVKLGAVFCLAFHRDLLKGKGTLDCVKKCLAFQIPVWLIDSEDAVPRRLMGWDPLRFLEPRA